ncbi:MAG: hypothetical protein LBL87_03550 [Ruminococcus sp.]|jgi:hypothetical protein|nr:hypothetical protein [Ruminococcus sp.]
MDGLLPIIPQPVQSVEIVSPVGKNGVAQAPGTAGLPNLSDTTVVGQTNTSESTDADHSGSDLSSESRGTRVSSYSQRDPAVGARIMRAAFGSDTLASIAESGDAKLLNKITEFAQEIMLRRDNLGTDFKQQQDESTVFGKDLWQALNDLLKGRGVTVPEAKLAEGTPGGETELPEQAANAANSDGSAANSQNIDKSTTAKQTPESAKMPLPAGAEKSAHSVNAANTAHMSDGKLTGEQLKAALHSKEANAALGGKLNTAFKQAVVDLLRTATAVESKTDTAASLSANLRFLASEAAPSVEVRNRLLNIANELTADNFPKFKDEIQSLLGKTAGSLNLNNMTKNLIPLAIHNMSKLSDTAADLSESFREILNMSDPETAEILKKEFVKYVEESNMTGADKAAVLQTSGIPSAQRSMTLMTERLADAISKAVAAMTDREASEIIKQTDSGGGANALKAAFEKFTPDNMKGALNTLFRDFDKTKNLNELLNRLSYIVNKLPDDSKKMIFADGLNGVLERLSKSDDVKYRPPTAADNLTEFLSKNIGDPALKSLSAMNPGDMLRSMLSAPSAATPLLHMMAPLQSGNMRAFGEMWIDPNAENPKGQSGDGSVCNHVFLVFDLEDVGYFEMELFAQGKDLNVMLLVPQGWENAMSEIKNTVPILAEGVGYKVKNTIVDRLKTRRDLPDVFRKLNETRAGLNVKA